MATELPETLLSDSTVWLFGRVMKDITITANAADYRVDFSSPGLNRGSANHLLANQLLADGACLARIYSFSFQNEIFDLVAPSLFLVHGDGVDPHEIFDSKLPPEVADQVGLSGTGRQGEVYSASIKVWAYDRDDFSLRLNMMTGPLNRILLEQELSDEGLRGFSRGGGDRAFPTSPGGGPRGRRRRWRADDD